MKATNFIAKITPMAQRDMAQNNILASLTIAQAILESAWGDSGLTKAANNLFGIKGKYKGQCHLSKTFEYYNGKRVDIVAEFRKYPSCQESLNDHSNFIKSVRLGKGLRYQKVIGETDYKLACKYIQQAGYATAPTYATTLIKLIEDYKLYEFDKVKPPIKCLVWVGHFSNKEEVNRASKRIQSELDCYNEIKTNPKNGQFFIEVKHFADKARAVKVKDKIKQDYGLYCEVRNVK